MWLWMRLLPHVANSAAGCIAVHKAAPATTMKITCEAVVGRHSSAPALQVTMLTPTPGYVLTLNHKEI